MRVGKSILSFKDDCSATDVGRKIFHSETASVKFPKTNAHSNNPPPKPYLKLSGNCRKV